jgi:hypothetical protein
MKKQAVYNQLEELIRLEKHDPYIMNHYYMDTINEFKEHAAEQKLDNTTKKKRPSSTTDNDD